MFIPGPHVKKKPYSVNDELLKIEGIIEDDDTARATFAKFLYANPTFATQLLMGIKLYPVQDMMIRAMFEKDFGLFVLSRGFSKTYSSAIFAALYAIFNPGVKIGILAPTFRQSKFIFKHIEDFQNNPKGKFLRECMGKISKSADAWEMNIGQSKITALPLGDGGRIRGYRFNLILIDEGLLLSEQVFNEVIRPFLNVYLDPQKRREYKIATDQLLAAGEVSQEDVDALAFPNQKLIVLSSASYTFEYLYKVLQDYESKILSVPREGEVKKEEDNISHVIFQLSYKVAPDGLLSQQNIKEGRAQMSAAQFDREYNARFTDGSDSFFSPKKMRDATLVPGTGNGTRIFGDKKKEYILAIDPNYSDSETSDHFAMCVVELQDDGTCQMVHGYALSKSNLTARAKYVKYLLSYFNIVYIIVDNAGGDKFIKDINEMEPFMSDKIELKFIEEDFDNDDYNESLKIAKASYNKSVHKICHARNFSSDWIRFANEHLQYCIEHKKILFSSELLAEAEMDSQKEAHIPIIDIEFTNKEADYSLEDTKQKLVDFIEHQSFMIQLTKTECGYIEVSTSPNGKQTFDLPTNLKRLTTPDRPRKDSYSALLLANYGAKCYRDMMGAKTQKRSFMPLGFS